MRHIALLDAFVQFDLYIRTRVVRKLHELGGADAGSIADMIAKQAAAVTTLYMKFRAKNPQLFPPPTPGNESEEDEKSFYTMSEDQINEALDNEALDDWMYYVQIDEALPWYTSEELIMREDHKYTMSDDEIKHALSDAPMYFMSEDQINFCNNQLKLAEADRRHRTKHKKRSLPTTSDSSGKPAAVVELGCYYDMLGSPATVPGKPAAVVEMSVYDSMSGDWDEDWCDGYSQDEQRGGSTSVDKVRRN